MMTNVYIFVELDDDNKDDDDEEEDDSGRSLTLAVMALRGAANWSLESWEQLLHHHQN